MGIRDIDDFEGRTIKEKNIRHLGVSETIDFIRKLDRPIHISFDVDALDPTLVSSTGTRVPDGLFSHEVEAIIETALQLNKLVSLDIVEFNEKLGDPVHSIHHVREVFKKAIHSDKIKASL